MKEIVILSGKGGTGKTSLAACLAVLARDGVICDCDVDAADLHLLLPQKETETHDFFSGQEAYIDPESCNRCGICQEECRFDAIGEFMVDHSRCEGCAFCSHICSEKAITMKEKLAGQWFISGTSWGPLVHARLGIAQENSGKLVTVVRNEARHLAEARGSSWVITDGPPGIGCPVISSLSGADLALMVTEPTLSGIHDLERVLGVSAHFRVPARVVINKADINDANTENIRSLCRVAGAKVLVEIPYDEVFLRSLIAGVPVVLYEDGATAGLVRDLWDALSSELSLSIRR